ncbi:MAG: hypothetical protein HC915_00720 [Anaerolineae bacterium]|nr:hypothetical protein [Anaerolineae bacterium]
MVYRDPATGDQLYPSTPSEPGSTAFPPQTCLEGTGPAYEWTYTIPTFPPTYEDPVVQQLRMRATRSNGTVINTTVNLTTELTNNNLTISSRLWDTATNSIAANDRTDPNQTPVPGKPDISEITVLRGDELTFDLIVDNNSATSRCNVQVNWYELDPVTGVETALPDPIEMNWPLDATPNRLNQAGSGADIATTQPDPILPPGASPDEVNRYRPVYRVTEETTDPLILIFEVDGRQNCSPGEPADQSAGFFDRDVITLSVSPVQIDTTLAIFDTTTNLPINEGLYPNLNDVEYRLRYSATNVGAATFEITNHYYCIVGSPVSAESCASGATATNNMYDLDVDGDPDADPPAEVDFGINPFNESATRQFFAF